MLTPKRPAKKATKKATAKRSGRVASGASKSVTPTFHIPQWSTACPDWRKRIVGKKPLTPCKVLFPEAAEEAWAVYSKLLMVDQGSVDNAPTFGELTLPWTRDFVDAVFGSECTIEGHPLEGRRMMKTFFMLISKKNGKSTLAAGIMLTALILNWRQSAEFLILSPTKEIADNSYKPIADAIKADSELDAMFQIQDHIRTITHRVTKATLKVIAADTQTVSGKKAVGILVDELHEFGKVAKAGQMLTEVTGGLMSRPEGFVIYLTTQSSEPPAGVFKDKLTYARKVRDGQIEAPEFYPIIYEFPEDLLKSKRYLLPENFYVTNPNMGASVDETYLQQLLREAANVSAKEYQDKCAKHLNVEVGMALADDNWPGAMFWEKQGVEKCLSLENLLSRAEVCTIGIDGGGLDDLLGLCVMGREKGTGKWLCWFHAWAHSIVMERRLEIAPRLQGFANDGDLTIVEMVGEDAEQVAEVVWQVWDSGLLDGIGMDPNAIGGILDAICAEREVGKHPVPLPDVPEAERVIHSVSQGFRLAGQIKTTERKLAQGVLVHAGRPMMTWCAGNAKVVVRGNAIVVTKQVSGTAKIDPLMALFCAVALMELNPESKVADWDFSQLRMVG